MVVLYEVLFVVVVAHAIGLPWLLTDSDDPCRTSDWSPSAFSELELPSLPGGRSGPDTIGAERPKRRT